ncbi:hypothetical protein TNIN_300501 [Trichonephila inaurata madagascariensis]|uniref:Uncharacterized protein n=1 Tax=Trichonephila inaurata madagascariensis TaxID=2747483 RepID=A0A8X6WUZ8_9ARAC|nr:hypothetical protein TNIN_300501 [Trichonephila inaurata madagascariensis]
MPKMRPPRSPLREPIDPSYCLRKILFFKVRNSVCVRKRTHAQLAFREQPVTQTITRSVVLPFNDVCELHWTTNDFVTSLEGCASFSGHAHHALVSSGP